MEDLKTYLTKELPEEERILNDLDDAIQGAIRVLLDGPFDSKKLWPYGFSRDKPPDYVESKKGKPKFSHSTTAMILTALQALDPGSRVRRRASSGYPVFGNLSEQAFKLSGKMKDKVELTAKKLIKFIGKSVTDKPLVTSGTYGDDDILSLGWLVEIAQQDSANNLLKRIGSVVVKRLEKVGEAGKGLSAIAADVLNTEGDDREVGDSSYILIRFTRLVIAAKKGPLSKSMRFDTEKTRKKIRLALDLLFQRFETRLHDQLSFKEIPDSRFDPAELAFCLEGMLLIRSESVDERLFDRVMSVMKDTQETVAYWRTETPMITEHTGQVLFPVSIETANSMLASFALFDRDDKIHDARGSMYIALIKRYWSWLKARQATVRWNGKTFLGWHSEHINDPKLIHTWETSQVLEFLLAFRDQLRRHMARQSLIFSYLKADRPKLEDITIKGTKIKGKPGDKNIWDKITDHFEPVTLLGPDFRAYKMIGKRFFTPRVDGDHDQADWSMLLYGPPGTGKSTLGENLAAALGVPFITVTVSDFLSGGEAEVEHRAKMVFKVLELQPLSVVLFDEMDQFMLDRDSTRYGKQETIFQFLTPGMLIKFAHLHDEETVIFIIATNYEDRIDAAIKRRGRIDRQYLMLPFDGTARLRILNGFPGMPEDLAKLSNTDKTRIEAASLFLGWGDLKRVASEYPKDINTLENELAGATRTTRLAAYESRFLDPSGDNKPDEVDKTKVEFDQGPMEEFGALLNLAEHCWDKLDDKGLKGDVRKTLERLLPTDKTKKDVKKDELKKAIEDKGLNFPTKLFT